MSQFSHHGISMSQYFKSFHYKTKPFNTKKMLKRMSCPTNKNVHGNFDLKQTTLDFEHNKMQDERELVQIK